MTTATEAENAVTLKLRGGNADAYNAREREILVEGPRGTGKTRTILEKLHNLCHEHPGLHALIVRKYQRTLAATCLTTLNEQVLRNGEGVSFYGGSDSEPAAYRYRNGSRILVGGMDNADKVKSSEYDIIYPNEVTELTEDDFESLLPLLRHQVNGERVIEAQRIISDCNPANSGHWVNQRCERGKMRRIKTTLRDNPAYYDDAGSLTQAGEAYLATLTSLTGPRRDRWLLGLWTGVENACYPMFDRSLHVRPLEPGLYFKATIIGEDYGFEHLCAVVALSIDQFNRRWVREVWAGADVRTEDGRPSSMDLIVAQFKEKYQARRGRVDPNQAKLALLHGFNVAKGGSGGRSGPPRLKRIDDVAQLFYSYEGSRVPTAPQTRSLTIPRGPFAEPDSPGIFLVEGMAGIEELANEMEGYHFIYTDTPKGKIKDVYRQDENRIAALEYANEEWEEGATLEVGAFPSSYKPEARVVGLRR